MNKMTEKRFWEIDFLRGIAIVMMIIFHLMFDLSYFGRSNISVSSGFWLYFARSTAIIFILLVGISLTISFSKKKNLNEWRIRNIKRGLIVFSWGLIITLFTWLFFREELIVFGILHFIGISIIISTFFVNRRYLNLLLGILLIFIGAYISRFSFGFSWFLWLGLQPSHFYTLDYYPILPWFGLVLIGLFFGNLLYGKDKRRFRMPDLSKNPLTRFFSFLGKHSLLIYLIHQPILIAVLYVVGIVG